ncbi:MAG TPA: hypothetical protein VN379_18780 [Sporomusa sp.]|nr:hypothetical protein [Sporomusa sp.]
MGTAQSAVVNSSGLCSACHTREMNEADRVFHYLRQHTARVSVDQIATEAGVKRQTVMSMLKRGWFLVNNVACQLSMATCALIVSTISDRK